MSLVSEALKKAEREAAARDARGRGQPAPFEAPLQPYRSRRSGGARTPLFAALGAGAALVALALLWWSSQQKAPVKGDTPAASAGTSVATTASAPEPVSLQPRAGAEPSPPSAPATPGLASAATPAAPGATSVSEPPVTPLATSPLPKTTPGTSLKPPSASEPGLLKPPAPQAAAAPARAAATVTTFGPGDYLRRGDFA